MSHGVCTKDCWCGGVVTEPLPIELIDLLTVWLHSAGALGRGQPPAWDDFDPLGVCFALHLPGHNVHASRCAGRRFRGE